MTLLRIAAAAIVLPLYVSSTQVWADPFSVSYLDGGTWNQSYVQGFSPSVGPIPNPSLAAGDTVYLNQFQFFKSGITDNAADIRLAIINSIFANLTGFSTSWSIVEGLSTNTIANTASIAAGDPITFEFDNLPLTYGNSYAAVFVNVGGGGELTPVLVSALTADYVETPPGSGTFHPETNYGTESEFIYATSNFITVNAFGMFFDTFQFAGDADFNATFSLVPEPGIVAFVVCAIMISATAWTRRPRP